MHTRHRGENVPNESDRHQTTPAHMRTHFKSPCALVHFVSLSSSLTSQTSEESLSCSAHICHFTVAFSNHGPIKPSSRSSRSTSSRHTYLHPHLHRTAADWALLHLGRASTASALVTARSREVRLGVHEADNARRLASDGGLGSLRPAGAELRVGERCHGGGRRRRRVQRHRSRCGDRWGSTSVGRACRYLQGRLAQQVSHCAHRVFACRNRSSALHPLAAAAAPAATAV
eukprot:scaffold42663_cov69-Phaeocystis_antarctica.AAC.1